MSQKRQKSSFKEFDEQKFKASVQECCWEEIYNCSNVEIAAEIFANRLNDVLDRMAPIRKFQTRKNYVPWMSKDTKVLKEKREAIYKKATSTDNAEDWRQFRALRNQVTSSLRQDKKMWESEKLDLVKNDSTGVWKEVKSWLGWGTSGTPTQLFWEGRLITSPLDLANSMNRFFLQKIQILRNSIPDNN